MTTVHSLLTTIREVRDATLVHLQAETNSDIREGMEINLDLLNRALIDAGWETGDEQP